MAKKISVKTIRDFAKEKLNATKTISIGEIEIELKEYLPIEKKEEIVALVIYNAFKGDGDIQEYNKALAEIMFAYTVIREYTNVNVMNDPLEMYDNVKSSGLLDVIVGAIEESEIKALKDLIESKRQEMVRIQELKGNLGYKLEGIIDLLGSKADVIMDTVKNFDGSKLDTLTSFIPEKERTEMLNGVNKIIPINKEPQVELSNEEMESILKETEDKISQLDKVEVVEDKVETVE